MTRLDRLSRLRLHDDFVELYAQTYREAKLSTRLTLRRRLLTEWRSERVLKLIYSRALVN